MTATITIADLTQQMVPSSRRHTTENDLERDGQLVVRAPAGASGEALRRLAHERRGSVYEKLARRELRVGIPPDGLLRR